MKLTNRQKSIIWKSLNLNEDFFDDIKNNRYDGMVITGAPVEQMEFEEVDYWQELCEILDCSLDDIAEYKK